MTYGKRWRKEGYSDFGKHDLDRPDFQLRLKPLSLAVSRAENPLCKPIGGRRRPSALLFLPRLPMGAWREKAHTPSLLAHRSFLSPQGNGRPRNASGINERLAGGKERKKSGHFRLHAEQRRARALAVISIFLAPFPIFLGTTPLGVHFSPSICPLFQSGAPLGISLHERNLLLNFSLPTKGLLFFLSFAP